MRIHLHGAFEFVTPSAGRVPVIEAGSVANQIPVWNSYPCQNLLWLVKTATHDVEDS